MVLLRWLLRARGLRGDDWMVCRHYGIVRLLQRHGTSVCDRRVLRRYLEPGRAPAWYSWSLLHRRHGLLSQRVDGLTAPLAHTAAEGLRKLINFHRGFYGVQLCILRCALRTRFWRQ